MKHYRCSAPPGIKSQQRTDSEDFSHDWLLWLWGKLGHLFFFFVLPQSTQMQLVWCAYVNDRQCDGKGVQKEAWSSTEIFSHSIVFESLLNRERSWLRFCLSVGGSGWKRKKVMVWVDQMHSNRTNNITRKKWVWLQFGYSICKHRFFINKLSNSVACKKNPFGYYLMRMVDCVYYSSLLMHQKMLFSFPSEYRKIREWKELEEKRSFVLIWFFFREIVMEPVF